MVKHLQKASWISMSESSFWEWDICKLSKTIKQSTKNHQSLFWKNSVCITKERRHSTNILKSNSLIFIYIILLKIYIFLKILYYILQHTAVYFIIIGNCVPFQTKQLYYLWNKVAIWVVVDRFRKYQPYASNILCKS